MINVRADPHIKVCPESIEATFPAQPLLVSVINPTRRTEPLVFKGYPIDVEQALGSPLFPH